MNDELLHYGILGMKWGQRNGPPYPLKGRQLSSSERYKRYKKKRVHPNSSFNKKHFDRTLTEHDVMSTLSYDENRLENGDMYYAAVNKLDKHTYNALFNRPVKDVAGRDFYKTRIDTKARRDMRVASEDSSIKMFRELLANDREFSMFVTNKDRMRKYFVDDKYKFKGYREARRSLQKMDDPNYVPSQKDVARAYRMFNYVIPYDGGGTDKWGARDVAKQRAKFFKKARENGYGAILDTNDALYGGFKATFPVIVFDKDNVVVTDKHKTTMKEVEKSRMYFLGRKLLGV